MLNIVLFGPPGAGKGTQAEKLVKKYGLNHISTGEVIREEVKRGTPMGLEMKHRIEKGELAPDSLVIEMITEYMEEHSDNDGNIFDGFPRTQVQAAEFDIILANHGLKVDVMLSLDVPDEDLITRIRLRALDSGRADDADISVIKNRIDVYKTQTAIVAEYYAAQDKYISIDGTGTIDTVFELLCQAIDKLKEINS